MDALRRLKEELEFDEVKRFWAARKQALEEATVARAERAAAESAAAEAAARVDVAADEVAASARVESEVGASALSVEEAAPAE